MLDFVDNYTHSLHGHCYEIVEKSRVLLHVMYAANRATKCNTLFSLRVKLPLEIQLLHVFRCMAVRRDTLRVNECSPSAPSQAKFKLTKKHTKSNPYCGSH
jgi:hypothetical protein